MRPCPREGPECLLALLLIRRPLDVLGGKNGDCWALQYEKFCAPAARNTICHIYETCFYSIGCPSLSTNGSKMIDHTIISRQTLRSLTNPVDKFVLKTMRVWD